LVVQFFFAWRIYNFSVATYEKTVKMVAAAACGFIVLVIQALLCGEHQEG
jgi:hypothetical protein